MTLRALALWCTLLGALVGCRPLYLPPIPSSIRTEERVVLGPATALTVEQQRFKAVIELTRLPTEGWLSLQWFDPGGRKVAADSIWVVPGDEGALRDLYAPPSLEPTPGRWWAIVSFDGGLLRQLFVVVPE